jgi:CHAT domain
MMQSEPSDTKDVRLRFRSTEVATFVSPFCSSWLDVTLVRDTLTYDTIEFLRSLVESADERACPELLMVLGRHLYEFVFRPDSEVREQFDHVLKWERASREHHVNLRLSFDANASRLAVWPFELFYRPDGIGGWQGEFLRTRQITILRDVESQQKIKTGDTPIKVLLAISEPDSPRADIQAAGMRTILEAREGTENPDVTLRVSENEPFGKLKATVEQFRPDIFHFHGHGDGGGGLYLPHPRRKRLHELSFSAQPLDDGVATTGQTIAALFTDYQPKLVILTACDTALAEVPFADVAQQLADKGIPAVVAMQFKLSVPTAEAFAERFYAALIDGEYIEPAFSAALSQLTERNAEEIGALDATRTFGTPVLFVNDPQGRLVAHVDAESVGGGIIDTGKPKPAACVFCGFEAVGDFCGKCGMPSTCPACKTPYPSDVTFCLHCGQPTPVPPTATDRPAYTKPTGALKQVLS